MKVEFNRNERGLGGSIQPPTNDEVKVTPGLWHASLDDAIRFGGDLTRAALQAMNFKGDRRHIVVDTKVHMLKPGFMPAIPGWHTDGVPRGERLKPDDPGLPDIEAQRGYGIRPPHYHLLVTGKGCRTLFLNDPIVLEVPDEPSADLYAMVTRQVEANIEGLDYEEAPECTVVEWDWWDLHTAQEARVSEWRFLIRATETDDIEPEPDLRKIVRTQEQVYVPREFGW